MGPEAYAEAVNRFAPALRRADPSIRILACGSGGYGQGWNRRVIELAGANIDYISTHHYENPDAFASGIAPAEAYYRELKAIIDAGPNPGMQIYCSEWNAQSTDWRTGLYGGGLLNVFERCGDFFTMGGPALFLRHLSASGWDNAFVNFDHTGWFPAPNYVVMSLWREHYAPNRVALEGDAGPLNLVATASEDGDTVYVKAVNASDTRHDVALQVADAFVPGPVSARVVAPGSLQARNTLSRPDAVRAVQGDVAVDGQHVLWSLPSHSAGVVTIRRSGSAR
jgi:alpha-N-arabinofuranosidase